MLNEGYRYTSRVMPGDAGRTVLEHHVLRFPHSDAATWSEHVAGGRVLVNGQVASEGHVLRAGDTLVFRRPPWSEPDVPLSFGVVFEDEDVIAVDKPAGLQVLPAGRFLRGTLLEVVRAAGPGRAEWTPAHRLGRGTSGLVLFGKTARARASLAAQFRDRRVGKLYLAWVAGSALPAAFEVCEPIGRVVHGGATAHSVVAGGKPSVTRVRVLVRDAGRSRSLVAAVPVTGRPDQIRIHLAAAGAPLLGDPLYGASAVLVPGARPGDIGYLLHATRLRLRHPAGSAWLRLECRPPAGWGLPVAP